MSAQSFVFGYIEIDPDFAAEDAGTLERWSFDARYPFPDLFSRPRDGFRAATISFAGSVRDFEEEWSQWLSRFEDLLRHLHGRTALVHLETEHGSDKRAVGYVSDDAWKAEIQPRARRWRRFVSLPQSVELEETVLEPFERTESGAPRAQPVEGPR